MGTVSQSTNISYHGFVTYFLFYEFWEPKIDKNEFFSLFGVENVIWFDIKVNKS